MEWTIKDTLVLGAMALAIVGMSFAFPALGLTASDDEVDTADVPEYNVSQDRFDFAGDLPEFPLRPDQGTLNNSSTKFDDIPGNIQDELGEDANNNRTFIVAINATAVHLTDVSTGGKGVTDVVTFTAEDETQTLQAEGFTVDVHASNLQPSSGEFEYIVTERPGGSTFLGSLFNTADALVNVLAYIFLSIVVVSQIIVQFVFNVGLSMLNIATFIIDFLIWQITTLQSIVATASAWAAVFVLLPSIVLFFQFTKLTLVIVEVIYPFA